MADLVPSTRLIDRDEDGRSSPNSPVAVKTQTITIADGETSQTDVFSINGRVVTIITSAPDIPSDANFDVAILDEDGNVIHDETGISDNGIVRTNITGSINSCAGNTKVRVDFTTALSGNTVEVDVKLEYINHII